MGVEAITPQTATGRHTKLARTSVDLAVTGVHMTHDVVFRLWRACGKDRGNAR